MLPGQPSRTLVPAIARAAHQLFDAPLILHDPLAVGLVPETSRQTLLATAGEHRTEAARLCRSLFAVRSRFAEDRLAAAVNPRRAPIRDARRGHRNVSLAAA